MTNCSHDERLLTEIIAPHVTKTVNYAFLERTIREWTAELGGRFLIYTQDRNFQSLLRSSLTQIEADPASILTIRRERDILSNVKIKGMAGTPLMLFVDYDRVQRNLGELVKQLAAAYSQLRIVILTNEADVFEIALLHEIGAHNFIVTPVSTNSLVAKIALTIKPHGKIGKYLDEAKRMVADGEAESALALAAKVLKCKSDSAAAHMVMGDAHHALGDNDEALRNYELACENAPLYLEPLKKLARFHGSVGNLDQQLKYMEKLHELSPLNVERKVSLGRLYLRADRGDDAQQVFDKALEHVEREAMARVAELSLTIADACQANAPDKAEAFYRKAMQVPGFDLRANIDVFNRLGSSLRKQGKWREALMEYDRALELSPEDENLYYNKALAYSDGHKADEAFASLKKTLSLNPHFHEASHVLAYNCALICKNAGRNERAAAFARAALDQDADYAKARDLLDQLAPDNPA